MGVTGTLKSLPRIVRMGYGEIDGENGKNPAWMLTSGQERTLMFAHWFDPFRIPSCGAILQSPSCDATLYT